jgi:hypothetical protein
MAGVMIQREDQASVGPASEAGDDSTIGATAEGLACHPDLSE